MLAGFRCWRSRDVFGRENVVIAAPIKDKPIFDEAWRLRANYEAWTLDENDVLGRFHAVAVVRKRTAPDTIIYRLTPDDWRRDVDAMQRVVNGETGIPIEIGGEAFTFRQLKEWHETVTDPFLREHIGKLITPNPVQPPDDGLPWSIDTQEQLDEVNAFLNTREDAGYASR